MTAAECAALHAACFTVPRPWSEAEFASLLSDVSVQMIESGQGFMLIRTVADESEVLTLAVHPDTRRRGTARKLLRNAEIAAGNRGAARMFLEVAADNEAAIGLYSAAGYECTGVRKGYFVHDDKAVDAWVMSKTL